eukprot:jgi/Mesvir1/20899/Mv07973-RA.1
MLPVLDTFTDTGAASAASNSAVMSSLRTYEKQMQLEPPSDILGRMEKQIAQVGNVQRLIETGAYANARVLLRKGDLGTIRADIRSLNTMVSPTAAGSAVLDPTEVTRSLEALDRILRTLSQGKDGGMSSADAMAETKRLITGLRAVVTQASR